MSGILPRLLPAINLLPRRASWRLRENRRTEYYPQHALAYQAAHGAISNRVLRVFGNAEAPTAQRQPRRKRPVGRRGRIAETYTRQVLRMPQGQPVQQPRC